MAFVGLGTMGTPMARRLIDKGLEVSVFDIREERMSELVQHGAQQAKSPAESARDAQAVVVMVADASQLQAAFFDTGGLAEGLSGEATVIVTGTVGVDALKDLAATLADKRVAVVDAAVSGGAQRAEIGELVIMVGANNDVFEHCRPVLEMLGSDIFHCGEQVGDGQAVKLVNQLLCGVHMAVTAEALAFAEALELDQQMVWDIVRRGAASSFMLEHRGPIMIAGGPSPAGSSVLPLFVKDLDLVAEAAERLNFHPRLSNQARELFRLGVAMNEGRDDDSVLVRSALHPEKNE